MEVFPHKVPDVRPGRRHWAEKGKDWVENPYVSWIRVEDPKIASPGDRELIILRKNIEEELVGRSAFGRGLNKEFALTQAVCEVREKDPSVDASWGTEHLGLEVGARVTDKDVISIKVRNDKELFQILREEKKISRGQNS